MKSFGLETFSGVVKDDVSETHGSVFCMDDKNKRNLDNAERMYEKEIVSVTTYHGEVIKNVNVYVAPEVR